MGKSHATRWDETSTAAANARRELPLLVAAYFKDIRAQLKKDPSPAKLHRLRLASKRLRYTLELFRPCYGPGLETRMAELRDLQKLLGDINDVVASEGVIARAAKAPVQFARVKKFLEKRAEHKTGEFRKHWEEVFDAAGREQWWTTYLAREARSRGAGSRPAPNR